MCHFAADALSQGRNVLYITLEMAEEKIAERIDANLFDVDIATLTDLSKDLLMSLLSGPQSHKKIPKPQHCKNYKNKKFYLLGRELSWIIQWSSPACFYDSV
mgnify:CR=1 FL=1